MSVDRLCWTEIDALMTIATMRFVDRFGRLEFGVRQHGAKAHRRPVLFRNQQRGFADPSQARPRGDALMLGASGEVHGIELICCRPDRFGLIARLYENARRPLAERCQ